MSEISGSRPLPPSPTAHTTAATNSLSVRLLSPLDGLLAAGESARVEVIAVREQAQHFNLQLRLTLHNGQLATVHAQSAKALEPGSNLTATALSGTQLNLMPQRGTNTGLTSLDVKQLPPDSLVQAKIIGREALNSSNTAYRLNVQLLNTPLAGKSLQLDTNLALSVGSLLTAKVQDSHNLNFLPMSSRLEQLALGQQLAAQHGKQGSLQSLLNALQGLSGKTDGALRASIDQLLGAVPDASKLTSAKGLAQALQNSGLLMESKLLQGQTFDTQHDIKANLLRLIALLTPQLSGPNSSMSAMASAFAQQLPSVARQLLGAQQPGSARQHPLNFPLSARQQHAADAEIDLEMLLKMAAAAISRLQTHQLSSLAQSHSETNGLLLTTWQLELPMRQQADIVTLQLKLQREEDPEKDAQARQREALWRIELAFDLDHLGPLQIRAQLKNGHLSSQLWAQRSETTALINTELDYLRQRLQATGLIVDQLSCHQGLPKHPPRTTLEQRWVDDFA